MQKLNVGLIILLSCMYDLAFLLFFFTGESPTWILAPYMNPFIGSCPTPLFPILAH
jgi:hypothetical protein